MNKPILLLLLVLFVGLTSPTNAQIQVIHDVPCAGQATGALIATPSGWGTGPYTFLWSTADTTQALHDIAAGLYSVVITDSLGVDSTFSVTLTSPDSILILAGAITPSDCDGHNNGAAGVNVSGGVAPYTYLWWEVISDSVYNTQNVSSVRGGDYLVSVTDNWGCTATINIIIPNLATVPVSFIIDSFVCNGLTGSVTVEADNAGVGSYYTYSWSTPFLNTSYTSSDSVFDASGAFLAGTYVITTVELATGCANYSEVFINQSATPLVVSETVVHNQCFGDLIAAITLAATGGDPLPDYQCVWSGPGGFTSTAFGIAGLASGDYIYVVSDDSACTLSGTIRIEPFVPLQGSVSITGVSCSEGLYGQAVASYSGGSGILTYGWSSGETTPVVALSAPGTYILSVTDSRGCTIIDSVTVSEGDEICLLIPNMITANGDGFNDVFQISGGCDMDEFQAVIYSSDGVQVFSSADCNMVWDPLTEDHANSGTVYYVYVRISRGDRVVEYKRSININY